MNYLTQEMANFVCLNKAFAKYLSNAAKPASCKLWAIGKGADPVQMVPKNTPGAIWLGWQRPRSTLACAIRLDLMGFELLGEINAQRITIMSRFLSANEGDREEAIAQNYGIDFKYLVKPIACFSDLPSVTLRRSDVLPEYYIFQVGTDDDYEELVTEVDILFYTGAQPKFRLAA
jgi:hypothetical protein